MILSFEEFEVLQLIASTPGLNQLKINIELPYFSSKTTTDALNKLSKKKLVLLSSHKITITRQGVRALKPYKVKRAVILAGGKGVRMNPETNDLPKALVKVGKKSIIETQLDALIEAGITDITVVRGYKKEKFDVLANKYPIVKYIDYQNWEHGGPMDALTLVKHLLPGAYYLECDLYIHNPKIIRTYEYRSSYAGISGEVKNDWYFNVSPDKDNIITTLSYGSSGARNNPYKFVGILFFEEKYAHQLAKDITKILSTPGNEQRFLESIPFDNNCSKYNIFLRSINRRDVTEIDTYAELQALRSEFINNSKDNSAKNISLSRH